MVSDITSNVQICNFALQRLGESTQITVIDDTTVYGKRFNLIFEQTRDEELRANIWQFAVKRSSSTLTAAASTSNTGWLYAYNEPSDCLRIVDIYQLNVAGVDAVPYDLPGVTPWPFLVEGSTVYTNLDTPYCKYIAQITSPTSFDPLFVDALACRLATKIAVATSRAPDVKQILDAEYAGTLLRARAYNAIERKNPKRPSWWWRL